MEEKTEAVKSEETTVGLTMNYKPVFVHFLPGGRLGAGGMHLTWLGCR